MRFRILVFLLCSTSALYGQATSETRNQLTVGLSFSPGMYMNATSISEYDYIGYEVDPSGFTFSTGITAHMALNRRFDFGAGLLYSQKNYISTFYCYVCAYFGVEQPEPVKERIIEIPLFARYNLLDKKFRVHVETGLSGGYVINNSVAPEGEALLKHNLLLSGNVGVGVGFDLGRKFVLNITPFCKFPLTDFSQDATINSGAVGVFTEIQYRLSKE
jgi:hypothetical protein